VAITVASGSGFDVAEVGRNIPVAVFCAPPFSSVCVRGKEGGRTYGLGFKALDEDAVEEGDEGPDGLEGSLGSLCNTGQKRTGTSALQRTITYIEESKSRRDKRTSATFSVVFVCQEQIISHVIGIHSRTSCTVQTDTVT
jgi:hypothetical protein